MTNRVILLVFEAATFCVLRFDPLLLNLFMDSVLSHLAAVGNVNSDVERSDDVECGGNHDSFSE